MIYDFEHCRVRVPDSGLWWVAPGAMVIGNVVLEDDASIWFNAVVRGDNETITIGPGSNVQDGAVLHTDPGFPLTLGVDCTLGHQAMVHGATVEDGSLIGIGATILNGAVIGAGSLIGARALVPEGRVIPPRSLVVGVPGKIIRTLDDEDVAALRRTAAGYKAKWRRFKSGMTERDPA